MKRWTVTLLIALLLSSGCVSDDDSADMRSYDSAMRRCDFGLCERIKDPMTKQWCYISVGNLLGDEGRCDRLAETERGLCLSGVASARKDPGICERLEGEQMEDCLILVSRAQKDQSYCERLSGDGKDNCYLSNAVSLGELRLCCKISDEALRDRCYLLTAKIR